MPLDPVLTVLLALDNAAALTITPTTLESRLTVGELALAAGAEMTEPTLALGGTVATYLEPLTDGTLQLTVKTGGVLRDDATVRAVAVYSPTGATVATNVSMPATGGGTGIYTLSIPASWSDDGTGKAVEGEFVVVLEAIRAGTRRTRRYRYPVRWDDDS